MTNGSCYLATGVAEPFIGMGYDNGFTGVVCSYRYRDEVYEYTESAGICVLSDDDSEPDDDDKSSSDISEAECKQNCNDDDNCYAYQYSSTTCTIISTHYTLTGNSDSGTTCYIKPEITDVFNVADGQCVL